MFNSLAGKLGQQAANADIVDPDSMLIVLPVPFRERNGTLLVESQALNGLKRWADNFSLIRVAAPVVTDHHDGGDKVHTYVDPRGWDQFGRIEFLPLTSAYKLSQFIRAYRPTRKLLAKSIARSQYLQFAIGGLVGDWAAVAACEARSQDRKYAVHTDRVEHRASVVNSQGLRLRRRIKAVALAPIMRIYEAGIIRDSELALLHGADCFAEYARISKNPQLIHNIHSRPADCATVEAAESKAATIATRPELRICYTGRMAAEKAPLDWLRALNRARELGVAFEATWLGDGPLLEDARRLARELGLENCVRMPGFVSDRACVLETIQRSDVMLFCHVTPESPRCLIESLVCATPLVGYGSRYSEDLVSAGGGLLTPIHDWSRLGEILRNLSDDREALANLICAAQRSGSRFNDVEVFRERSEYIKKYLA